MTKYDFLECLKECIDLSKGEKTVSINKMALKLSANGNKDPSKWKKELQKVVKYNFSEEDEWPIIMGFSVYRKKIHGKDDEFGIKITETYQMGIAEKNSNDKEESPQNEFAKKGIGNFEISCYCGEKTVLELFEVNRKMGEKIVSVKAIIDENKTTEKGKSVETTCKAIVFKYIGKEYELRKSKHYLIPSELIYDKKFYAEGIIKRSELDNGNPIDSNKIENFPTHLCLENVEFLDVKNIAIIKPQKYDFMKLTIKRSFIMEFFSFFSDYHIEYRELKGKGNRAVEYEVVISDENSGGVDSVRVRKWVRENFVKAKIIEPKFKDEFRDLREYFKNDET